MNPNYLDFEQPIAELEMKIEELKSVVDDSEINISDEIDRLKSKSHKLTQSIYSDLSPWDIVRVARHPLRPYSLDYIPLVFDDFDELHGDRHFGDDKAIVGGVARLNDVPLWSLVRRRVERSKIRCTETLVCRSPRVIAKHCA